jgi:hypothetical protein
MPSVRAMKCPVCGVQDGPCIGGTPTKEYHVERIRAANPTTYEHPECEECRKLRDAMVDAEWSLRTCRPEMGTYKSRSRWPKAWKEEHYQREKAASLARAKYHVHLVTEHKDKAYEYELGRNMDIVLRDGRVKP